MKIKIIGLVVAVLLTFTACSEGLRPLSVDYKVTGLEEYEKDLKNSRVKQDYSDNQVTEIGFFIKSNKLVCIEDTIYVLDLKKSDIDKGPLLDKYPEYKNVNMVASDEIAGEPISVKTDISDEALYNIIVTAKAVKVEPSGNIYPVTDGMKELANTAKYKSEFISSIRRIMNLG